MKEKIKHLIYEYRFVSILSVLFTIVHYFIVKNRDKVTFTFPDNPRLYVYGTILLAFFVCFLLYLAFFTTIHLLYHKNKTFLTYFKYFCIYGFIMGIFFLLTWPGIFKGDEFYVIRSALNFELSPAQSGITSIFYIVCLLIFPSMATITFLQLLIICIIFSYIMKSLFDLYPKKSTWLVMLVFLLPPVIDGNLFTLRSTLVGWTFLLIISKLYFAYKRNHLSLTDFLILSIASGLVTAWRSEFVYLLLLLPLGCLFLRLVSLKRCILMVLIIALSFTTCNLPNKIALNGSNKYPISLVLNPVANLFTEVETLKGPDVYDDVMTINELVDASLLRRSASVRNISQYWNIPDVLPQEQLNRFMKASLRLIVYNPGKFLKYRLLTFAHTNGLYPDEINHPGGESVDSINQLIYYGTDYKSMFVFMNPPLGQTLREKTISLLACREYRQGGVLTNIGLPLFYNCIPTIILLVGCLIVSLVKKKKGFLTICFLAMVQLAFIFLTAPAMFFMYYYSFYLCGYFIILLHFLERNAD